MVATDRLMVISLPWLAFIWRARGTDVLSPCWPAPSSLASALSVAVRQLAVSPLHWSPVAIRQVLYGRRLIGARSVGRRHIELVRCKRHQAARYYALQQQ